MLVIVFTVIAFAVINGTAQELEYSTYIGNAGWDQAYGVTVAENGNVIITGWTEDEDFPTTSGVFDNTHNGDRDIFVSVFTADLSQLLYSTLIGGSEWDLPYSILIDHSNNILVGGYTKSDNFPTTADSFDPTHNDSTGLHPTDGVVFLLSSELDSLIASTYLGGNNSDDVRSMIIDSAVKTPFSAEIANSAKWRVL
jgi:hypothetical protein